MTEYARTIAINLLRPHKNGQIFDFFGSWWSRKAVGIVLSGILLLSIAGALSAFPKAPIGNQNPKPKVFAIAPIDLNALDNHDNSKEDFFEEFGLYPLSNLPKTQSSFKQDIRLIGFADYLDPLFLELFSDVTEFIGLTLGVIPPSKGPFSPITFDPSSVICPVPGVPPQGGGPFVGTHNDCKNYSGGETCSGSWQSENGTDWIFNDGNPAAHPVLALIGGILSDPSGTGGCGPGFGAISSGFRMYLCGDDGNIYYMAHLDPNFIYVTGGQRVTKGQPLGLLNLAYHHLHISIAGNFNCSSCSNLPSSDDAAIATWDAWYKCCNGKNPGTCTDIPPPPLPPGGGGGGGGGGGLIRPLPEPFECTAPDVTLCKEPPNSLTPAGYTQENCIPIDPTCSNGTCFGVCADENGEPSTNPEEIMELIYEYDVDEQIVKVVPNPIGVLLNADTEGNYCAYDLADRCGGDDGACAFILECEQKRVCNENDQCVLKPGRNLVGSETSCESNADCRTSYNTCVGSQCVSVSGAGEDECGIAGSLTCPQCVREVINVFDSSGVITGTEEVCERPPTQQTCVTQNNASLYYLKSSPTDAGDVTRRERLWTEIPLEEYLIDNPYFGTTLEENGGGQCAQVTCIDENGDGEITWNIPGEPNECAPPAQWCSNETACGIGEIIGVEPPEEIGDPPEILCGDGICATEEEEGGEFACEVDCILRQDPLPPFPHFEGVFGELLPVSTCSDTTGDGSLDSCVIGGESTILCNENLDCTREFRSGCKGDICEIVLGPGINQCGAPTTPIDTPSLDASQCNYDCSATEASIPSGCSVGSGFCSPEFQSGFWPMVDVCIASVVCNGESRADPFALNDGCLDPPPSDYSVGLFQMNLNAGTGRCPGGLLNTDPGSGGTGRCVILDQAILDTCMADFGYGDPIINSQRAVELWESQGWNAWSVASTCNLIN